LWFDAASFFFCGRWLSTDGGLDGKGWWQMDARSQLVVSDGSGHKGSRYLSLAMKKLNDITFIFL